MPPLLVPGTSYNQGTTWLTTPRCAPAWTAALDLLADDHWHPIPDLARAMHAAADLAPSTIRRHIHSACCRGWIRRKAGHVRLRDRTAIETALDLAATA